MLQEQALTLNNSNLNDQNMASLSYLNLSNNRIKDAGAISLANLLKTNTSLEFIDLSRNEISHDGINALLEALESNRSLQEISLDFLSLQNFDALAHLIRVNPFGPRVKIHLNEMRSIYTGSICTQDNFLAKVENLMQALVENTNGARAYNYIEDLLTMVRWIDPKWEMSKPLTASFTRLYTFNFWKPRKSLLEENVFSIIADFKP